MGLDIDLAHLDAFLRGLRSMTEEDYIDLVYEGRNDYVSRGAYSEFCKDRIKGYLDLDPMCRVLLFGKLVLKDKT